MMEEKKKSFWSSENKKWISMIILAFVIVIFLFMYIFKYADSVNTKKELASAQETIGELKEQLGHYQDDEHKGYIAEAVEIIKRMSGGVEIIPDQFKKFSKEDIKALTYDLKNRDWYFFENKVSYEPEKNPVALVYKGLKGSDETEVGVLFIREEDLTLIALRGKDKGYPDSRVFPAKRYYLPQIRKDRIHPGGWLVIDDGYNATRLRDYDFRQQLKERPGFNDFSNSEFVLLEEYLGRTSWWKEDTKSLDEKN